MPSSTQLMAHLFVQVAVILAVCWTFGRILRRLGQTQVVSDMVAGFVLGPSLLGLTLPDVQQWLFPTTLAVHAGTGDVVTIPHPNLTTLYALGQIGLVFYMFLVGMSFDTKILAGHLRSSLAISLTGVLVPLLAGGVLGWVLVGDERFFSAGIAGWQGALFVGCAVAIAAFPMLARIIHDSGLARTRLGTMALACAAIDDAVAWILLALVVSTTSGNPITVYLAAGGAGVYFLTMLGPGRWLLRRLDRQFGDGTGGDETAAHREVLMITAVVVLACAAFTESVGVYSVFGAFVAGTMMPRSELTRRIQAWVQPLTTYVLLPTFFVYSGLNTHLDLLIDPVIAGVLIVTVVVSFIAKGGACYLACRLNRFTAKESASLAALMNARGLMELILLDIGRNAGLVTPALYTVMALMTILTTLAASPLYLWAQRRWTEEPPTFTDQPGVVRSA